MNTYSNELYGFKVKVLSKTEYPEKLIYAAMHQCYYDDEVELPDTLSSTECGKIIIKRLLEGNKGHYSPAEHASITFNLVRFNIGTINQLIRHRIGVAISQQSFRYTCNKMLRAANGEIDINEVIYFRPEGLHTSRDGKKVNYTSVDRENDVEIARMLLLHYRDMYDAGYPPEFARGMLPFDYRTNLVYTLNARSLMHVLDLRAKKDAQIEIQILSDLIFNAFFDWIPTIANWYKNNRYGKAILSP